MRQAVWQEEAAFDLHFGQPNSVELASFAPRSTALIASRERGLIQTFQSQTVCGLT